MEVDSLTLTSEPTVDAAGRAICTRHPAYLISTQAVTAFTSYASIVAATGYVAPELPPALPGV